MGETLQHSGIQNSNTRHILKSLASLYKSSGSQFFRTTTGVLVLEGKTGKEVSGSSRLEFLEKFLANNFDLPDI